MLTQLSIVTLTLLALQGCAADTYPSASLRVAVVQNGTTHFAFMSIPGKALVMSTSSDGTTWNKWFNPMPQPYTIVSNPVAVLTYVEEAGRDLVMVFGMSQNGQVVALVQTGSNLSKFQSYFLTYNLPSNRSPSSNSLDSIQVVSHNNNTYVFVRTLTKTSQVYWNIFTGLFNFTNKNWTQIDSGSSHLIFDPYAAVNKFLGRVEVFAVSDSGHMMHTWQDGAKTFNSKWKKLGGLFSPKFNSAPVVHQMGHSDFNGVLSLFVRGTDGKTHNIAQTTCDKVKNVWGPCTWTTFRKVGGSPPPSDPTLANPFVASHSFHGGIEIFTVGKAAGHLFHMWQRERGDSYSNWDDMGPLSSSSSFHSTPAIFIDDIGWWVAVALDSGGSLTKFLEKPIKFVLSSDHVKYGLNITVTWAIPNDQATHMDWIGVYQHGAIPHHYLDFSYVGGTQNPLKDPVPQGSLDFTITLPPGQYDFKYMVNKAYVAALQTSATVSDQPSKENWVFLFDGLSRGLGPFKTNVTKCAVDGDKTLAVFKAALIAFEDRKIFDGLHLLAEGLGDFKDALVQCNETVIIKDLTAFIADLVACTEDYCVKFLIDVGLEVVILYEHVYEIYGDVQGASNSFKIEAFEQGGFCIGRVTSACLTLE